MYSEELKGNLNFDQQTVARLLGEDIAGILQEKNIPFDRLLFLDIKDIDAIFPNFEQGKRLRAFIHSRAGPGTETQGADKIPDFHRLKTGKHPQDQGSCNPSLPLSEDSKRQIKKREPNHETPSHSHGPIVRKKSMEVREVRLGKPSVFKLEMHCHTSVDKLCIPIYEVGRSTESATTKEKNFLLVGATGVGKKTLINGIANFLFGVKWEDDFRFAAATSGIVQKSQTYSPESDISVYKFACQPNFPIDYSVTIIYVPGIGGSNDFEADKKIVQQMQDFFQLETCGIDHLHAIVLTIKATDTRVTPWQQYVYTSVRKFLVGGTEENMIVVATHSDGPQIRALRVLKETDVPYNEKLVFAINNAALYCSNVPADDDDEEDILINKLQWKRNTKAYRDFFNALDKMAPQQISRERMTAQDLSEVIEEPQQPSHKKAEPQQSDRKKVKPQQSFHEEGEYHKSSHKKAEPQQSDRKKVKPQQSFHEEGEYHKSSHKKAEPQQSDRKKVEPQQSFHEEGEYHKSSHKKAEPQQSNRKKVEPQQSFHEEGEYHKSSHKKVEPQQSDRKKIKSQRTIDMLTEDMMTSQEMFCDFISTDRQGVLDSLKRQGQLAFFQMQLFKRKKSGGSRSKGSIIPRFIELTGGKKAYYCRTCKWMCFGPSFVRRDPSHLESKSTCEACICVLNCKESDHYFEEYETQFALVDADLPHGLPWTEMGANSSDPMKSIFTISSTLRRAFHMLQSCDELLKFVDSIVNNSADMRDMEEYVQSLQKCAKFISANPDISDEDLRQSVHAHFHKPAKGSGSKFPKQCPIV